MDYSFYYRKELKLEDNWGAWDLFISAYNLSARLNRVFHHVQADNKIWLAFPEYDFLEEELPIDAQVIRITAGNESNQLKFVMNEIDLDNYIDQRVCVDATGFMRPQLLFILLCFKKKGFKNIDFLYSEPNSYSKREKTKFAYGAVTETRQVIGYAGVTRPVDKRDLLIIASGYDSTLIGKVAQCKENAEIIHIFGFPSLRPDMYQENILRTVAAADSFTGNAVIDPMFAPASDPFETASTIKCYIDDNNCLEKYRHIYICPLSTKAQTLGVGLVYLNEYQNLPVSLIYPFTDKYEKETSIGLVKMWQYTIEFE